MIGTELRCQSCGMSLSRDAQGGGTNTDGSRNKMYCSHCYLDGTFTKPYLDAKEMQERVKVKLMERGIPGFFTGFLTRDIPKLNRWKKG